MFKKLHGINEDSGSSIRQLKRKEQITYKKNFVKSVGQSKRIVSYGQKFRKKNNLLPNIPELQIIESETFLFEGRLASVIQGSSLIPSQREKHGQGVMFLKNGTLIVGSWDHGFLHGKALVFTPFGGRTIAHFYNGKLNGWAITIFAQKLVVCAEYYQNKIDSQKIIFEANQQMWVGSRYAKQSDSYKIIHVQKGKVEELPAFLKYSSTELSQLYDQFIRKGGCCIALDQIKFIPITTTLTYIGYCNQDGHPSGLGAIYGSSEFYLGHYREGSLQCYGRMVFQNGQIYQGQLLNGTFYGQGVYYNPSKNVSTIMSTNREENKVIDEQQGYVCIGSSLNYFKFTKHAQSGMIGDPLNSICEILQKYYSTQIPIIFSYFVGKRHSHRYNNSFESDFGISQNNDDVDSSLFQAQSPAKRKEGLQREKGEQSIDQQKRWLNFNVSNLKNKNQSNFSQSAHNQEQIDPNLQRAYSLDKRETVYNRKQLAQQLNPINLYGDPKAEDQDLQQGMQKLKLDRNFSLKQKKIQSTNVIMSNQVKQNIDPQQLLALKSRDPEIRQHYSPPFTKMSTLNLQENNYKNHSLDIVTFRNQVRNDGRLPRGQQSKVDRKYSHMIQSGNNFSPQQSVVSNLSHKVQGMLSKVSTKRKKIFM